MIIGYARVSSVEQNLALQIDALKLAGCAEDYIFTDKVSGSRKHFERPGLDMALKCLRPGDVFIVWKLDRLGRSLSDLIRVVNNLSTQGIEFKSLSENIDTTHATGKLMFHFFAMVAEFELDLIRERTKAGIAIARKKGQRIGGEPKLNKKQVELTIKLARDPDGPSVSTICQTMGISKRTYYRILKKAEKEQAA